MVIMAVNPEMVVVTEELCNACGTPRVNVHHQGFPEMVVSGESPRQAAGSLLTQLESNLDAVSDPTHREPVQRAIGDVQAYVSRGADSPAKLSEVIDTAATGTSTAVAAPNLLAKTNSLEVRRLTLPKGREIPTHQARGEITVHCLAGRIEFTSGGIIRDIGPGQLIVLAAGEPHSLVGMEDSIVLVTKLVAPPAAAPAAS
jgi:quercetin dioxygenase-like cupin family protein